LIFQVQGDFDSRTGILSRLQASWSSNGSEIPYKKASITYWICRFAANRSRLWRSGNHSFLLFLQTYRSYRARFVVSSRFYKQIAFTALNYNVYISLFATNRPHLRHLVIWAA